jgi:hypothetical protein
MLCSHEKKFIYLKTRKTAGTSVEILFERFCLPPGQLPEGHWTNQIITQAGIVGARGPWLVQPQFYNHMPASKVRNILGREIFDSYFKFCTMRNPFDKIVSGFWWKTPDFSNEPFSNIKRRFTDFVLQRFGRLNDRMIFMIDGHSVIDQFIRYEHLTTDVEQVCKALGIEISVKLLGNYKSGLRKRQEHFSEYYDPLTKGLVEQEFAWEINRFGYSL